jgi:hypothetical protein
MYNYRDLTVKDSNGRELMSAIVALGQEEKYIKTIQSMPKEPDLWFISRKYLILAN